MQHQKQEGALLVSERAYKREHKCMWPLSHYERPYQLALNRAEEKDYHQ